MLKVLLIRAPGYGPLGGEIAKLTGWFTALHIDENEEYISVRDFAGTLFRVKFENVQMHKKVEAIA